MANYTRMKELIEFLNHHQELYDKSTPAISDKEWDDAYFELKKTREEAKLNNTSVVEQENEDEDQEQTEEE